MRDDEGQPVSDHDSRVLQLPHLPGVLLDDAEQAGIVRRQRAVRERAAGVAAQHEKAGGPRLDETKYCRN
ncbi:hypothetical protein ACFSJ1_19660 [Trinickia caryophylli]|uniref:hypothetical protein n=1 Tax=Trinickia caryophylli TaxID=28094 RepID=UPI00363FB589